MRTISLLFTLIQFVGACAFADTVKPVRTIKSQTIITSADVVVESNDLPSAIAKISDVVGFETRVVLYQGRAIRAGDIGPVTIVERNQIVTLVYMRGALSISTEARALQKGAAGDAIRVMNLSSRSTISGIVAADGSVVAGKTPEIPIN